MASNEEILKSIHAEKVINWDKIFRQNPSIIESAYEAMDAARKDEAVAFAGFTCGKFKYNKFYKKWQQLYSNNEFTTEQLYTIFKNQNS